MFQRVGPPNTDTTRMFVDFFRSIKKQLLIFVCKLFRFLDTITIFNDKNTQLNLFFLIKGYIFISHIYIYIIIFYYHCSKNESKIKIIDIFNKSNLILV